MVRAYYACALAAALTAARVAAARPARGFNPWFAFDTHLNETGMLANAEALVSTGLAAAGYTLVALDGGWQGGRFHNGTVFANATTFPSGLLALSRRVQALGLEFGAYTDRGGETCDGRVGSAGHEAADAAFYASIEASYLKEDSCFATQSHAGALAQFALMQGALAATGRAFTFSLCGWLKWYSGSASEARIGTSWRVGPDALNWPNVLMNMDAAADAARFVSADAFVDVDEVMGPSRGRPINATRTLTQLAFIAVVGSPLLLSFDLPSAAEADIAPFLNSEVLAVHWDSAPGGASYDRVAGGQLAPDRISPLTRVPCAAPAARWTFAPADARAPATGVFAAAAAPGLCLMAGAAWAGECNNAQGVWLGACGDAARAGPNCCWSPSVPGNCTNQLLTINADGTITTPYWPANNNAAGPYMTLDAPTPNSLFFEERLNDTSGAAQQQWRWDAAAGTLADAAGTCVGAAPRDETNVWARRLDGGDVALLFINNGRAPQSVSCDADCCAAAGLARDATLTVRDLFARTDNGTAACGGAGVAFTVPAGGASVFVRVSPAPAVAAAAPWPCAGARGNASAPAWCDEALALDARVAALVAALPPADLVGALTAQPYPTGGSGALGVPPTSWWQEATHGAATRAAAAATFFPMPSHTAQAFNASLVAAIARAVGAEGRALGNVFAPAAGWGFWAPNVNPVRDPRWGRAQEVMGEDVTVCAAWAAAYVRGLQEGDGTDPRYLQVAATVKHFAAYDFDGGSHSGESASRSDFDAAVTLQDLGDSYLPPFQAAVEAGVAGVMASYTSINGVPSAANAWLLTEKLGEWEGGAPGYGGYVTGDCGAVEQVATCARCHNYTATNSSTVAAVISAGLTMDCGRGLSAWTAAALADGAVNASALGAAAARNLHVRFTLGAFDDPAEQPMAAWGLERVCAPAAAALSLAAAEAGMVLLKNFAPRGLPLSRTSLARLALVGGNANDSMAQMCSYFAEPCGGFGAIVTPLAALTAALPRVDYARGCSTGCGEGDAGFAAAAAAAAAADATLIVAGLNCQLAGEGNDRASIALPGRTDDLIAAVCAAAAPRPCVLALATGSSLDISRALANDNVSAVLLIGYAGPAGGTALARALLGDAPPPAGRLAATWFTVAYAAEVSPLEMGMRPGPSAFPPFSNPGHTHRFYAGNNTLLPFGFGLSYTTWEYAVAPPPRVALAPLAAAAAAARAGTIARALREKFATVVINVTNTGRLDSDDVVLAFFVPPGAGTGGAPLQELVGWARVFVRAGDTVSVAIDAPGAALTLVGADGARAPRAGVWTVRAGVRAAAAGGMGFAEAPLEVG